MKVSFIAPPAFIDLLLLEDYHLMLPSTYESYRNAKGYKILDNGAAEDDHQPTVQELLTIVDKINPDEVVVPDEIGNMDATLDYMDALEPLIAGREHVNYAGVIQGQDIQECLLCAREYAQKRWITTLMIPRWIANEHGIEARERLLHRIAVDLDKKGTPISEAFPQGVHFLGASKHLHEVRRLAQYAGGRGIDTSAPVSAGMKGINLEDHDQYVSRPDNFMELTPDLATISLILHNQLVYKRWAQGE